MSSGRALVRQIFLVLLEYCLFSKVVLQYQYQSFSIVLQYKTARLVHPCWLYRPIGKEQCYVMFNPNLFFVIHKTSVAYNTQKKIIKKNIRNVFYSHKSLKVIRQAGVGVDMNDHAEYSLSWWNCLTVSYFSSIPVAWSSSSSLAQNPSSWPLACLYYAVSHTVHRNYK
jgi:hypothetical protein